MQIWRIVSHHERPDEAAERALATGHISVGWGRIGDLRTVKPSGPAEISSLISKKYPGATNGADGGSSLWNIYANVREGDLAIVSAKGQRFFVGEITESYKWVAPSDAMDDYQHQVRFIATDQDPDDLWQRLGAKVSQGENPRGTVSLCVREDPKGGTLNRPRYFEGTKYDIIAQGRERDPKARKACIAHYGPQCQVCRVDFEQRYGELGRGFVHVHHVRQLSLAQEPREVDPVVDLVPLCPNCHAMVHRNRPPLSIDDLRNRYRQSGP